MSNTTVNGGGDPPFLLSPLFFPSSQGPSNWCGIRRRLWLCQCGIGRHCRGSSPTGEIAFGNSADRRSVGNSAEQVLLNKQQIWCGRAYLHCYLALFQPNQHWVNFPHSAGSGVATTVVGGWKVSLTSPFPNVSHPRPPTQPCPSIE